jgi:hypothetical protein
MEAEELDDLWLCILLDVTCSGDGIELAAIVAMVNHGVTQWIVVIPFICVLFPVKHNNTPINSFAFHCA